MDYARERFDKLWLSKDLKVVARLSDEDWPEPGQEDNDGSSYYGDEWNEN